jgi:hypothetical protein
MSRAAEPFRVTSLTYRNETSPKIILSQAEMTGGAKLRSTLPSNLWMMATTFTRFLDCSRS